MSFQLGAFSIPTIAGFDIEQQYEAIGGESIFRAISGRGIKQMTFNKLRVITSGEGWIPSGLEALDFAAQHALRCVVPRGIPADFSTRQATLPSARRADSGFTPFGVAVLADGSIRPVEVSLTGDVATLAAASGAVAYQVSYYPQLTVWITRPSSSGSLSDASYRWELVCEEV